MMTKQAELKKQAYESTLKSRALSVLIYLIDRSNRELTCFPAIPTMARQLHVSESTVKRALRELVEAGYVKKDSRFRENHRGQTSNLYTLVLFGNQDASDSGEDDGRKDCEEAVESAAGQKEGGRVTGSAAGQKEGQVELIDFDCLKKDAQEQEDAESVVGTGMAQMVPWAGTDVSRCTPVQYGPGMYVGAYVSASEGGSGEKSEETAGPIYMEEALMLSWTGVGVSLAPP